MHPETEVSGALPPALTNPMPQGRPGGIPMNSVSAVDLEDESFELPSQVNGEQATQHLAKDATQVVAKEFTEPFSLSHGSSKQGRGTAASAYVVTVAEAEELQKEIENLAKQHLSEVQGALSRWRLKGERIKVQSAEAAVLTQDQVESVTPSLSKEGFVSVIPPNVAETLSIAPKAAAGGKSPSGIIRKGTTRNRRAMTLFVNPNDIEKTRLERIVDSRCYELASIILIVANSAFIGLTTQYIARRAEMDAKNRVPQKTDTPLEFEALSAAFTFAFAADLIARWWASGLIGFWRIEDTWSDDFGWNMLDLIIVLIGFVDVIILLVSLTSSSTSADSVTSSFSVARVIRVVRIVKVARVIKVMKFFRELRMMIFSIINSMKSLVWVILILLLLFYVAGITFVIGATGYLDTSEKWNAEENANLALYFGSLDRSVISLYMAMSGGNDWTVYYEALELTEFYHLLFLIFITFAVFAVVNIIMGVFVDSAMQSSTTDQATLVQEELDVKKAKLAAMQEVFENLDEDGTGTFTIDEFENRLRDERVQAYFSTLKLDVGDAKALFRLLDYDQSNEITIDEFVAGCSQLQGEARSLDAKIMQFELKFIKEAVSDVTKMLRVMQGSSG
eukprot:TRINITY_DN31378_c0_g1_i1.p1 TRINITY_DN31378_c0_g1~~TRINITY_DN31378_c0_g1_i1.p1  ORF type:complete len:620 (-),score=104.43 TRINITY_DN31378_c0_g1_i1:84-1943(-)